MPTSDAEVRQSAGNEGGKGKKQKRCEYRHEWRKGFEETVYWCAVCGYRPSRDSEDWHEAESILYLREVLHPGDTVYTVLRHVSRSGMTRGIDVYYMSEGRPQWITAYVGHAIGSPQSMKDWRESRGLRVSGCGMDMGFHVVNSLSYVIFPTYKCLGKDASPRCPSNYHVNHRDTVQCEGLTVLEPGHDQDDVKHYHCWRSETVRLPDLEIETEDGEKVRVPQGKAHTITYEDGTEVVCPTCKGMGRYPNPEGPERWDLMHKDGYALRHEWL